MLADISAYAGIGKPAIVALTDLCREVFLALPDGASVQIGSRKPPLRR